MKNFETELPQNYKQVKIIDAKNAKISVVLNLIALAVVLACVLGAYFIIGVSYDELIAGETNIVHNVIRTVVFFVIAVSYIILHELVHGAAFKILTKQKLTFGITLTVAFCGVPKIYVYRKAALIAVLAPFVVFLPVLITLCFVLPSALDKMLAAFLLGMHLGGCCGDLWVAGVLAFKYRNNAVLMNDAGPTQTFYLPCMEESSVVNSEQTER